MGFKIYFDNDRVIEQKNERSLLECLENNNITSDYSCRGGYCGVCSIVKLEGEIYYTQEPIFSTKDNTILTCCCLPKSDIRIKLAYTSLN